MEKIVDINSLEKIIDGPLVDRFGRKFNYLRLAVNEYCNLRCIYCMPETGAAFKAEDRLLTKN